MKDLLDNMTIMEDFLENKKMLLENIKMLMDMKMLLDVQHEEVSRHENPLQQDPLQDDACDNNLASHCLAAAAAPAMPPTENLEAPLCMPCVLNGAGSADEAEVVGCWELVLQTAVV